MHVLRGGKFSKFLFNTTAEFDYIVLFAYQSESSGILCKHTLHQITLKPRWIQSYFLRCCHVCNQEAEEATAPPAAAGGSCTSSVGLMMIRSRYQPLIKTSPQAEEVRVDGRMAQLIRCFCPQTSTNLLTSKPVTGLLHNIVLWYQCLCGAHDTKSVWCSHLPTTTGQSVLDKNADWNNAIITTNSPRGSKKGFIVICNKAFLLQCPQ